MTEIGSFQRAGRSAVDRLLRKQEVSGSNPDRSILTLFEQLEAVLNKNFKMLIQGIK